VTARSSAPSLHPDFPDEVAPVLSKLREDVVALLRSVGVQQNPGPTLLARRLGIDTKLGWKIANLVTREDLFEAGQYVPGRQAFDVFLTAAEREGAPASLLEAVRSGGKSFLLLVKTHGGNRTAFDMLLAGQTREGRLRIDLEFRRQAFDANSYLLGVQAALQYKLFVLFPSREDPLRYDAAIVNAFVELRRLRSEVPWRMKRTYSVDDEGVVDFDAKRESLDDLLRPFGNVDRTALDFSMDPDGQEVLRLAPGPVGRTASRTLLLGEVLRAVEPRYRHERHRNNALHMQVQTPVESLAFEVICHRELFPAQSPRVSLFSQLFAGQRLRRPHPSDRLELLEELEEIADASSFQAIAELPRHEELLTELFAALKLSRQDFRSWRLRMRHPPTPSVIFLKHKLGNAPVEDPGS
jgi:hypothetical protein